MPTRRRSIYKSCIALSVPLICFPSSVFAQSDIFTHNKESSVIELKPIVIEKKADLLDNVTILTDRETNQDIDQKQIDDVHDISRLTPSVTYNSNNDSFVVRGLDSFRVLTTIDGIPLSWVNDGVRGLKGGSAMFDFGALSTLDVIRGSDSSIYGSGALSGIIALHTLNPEDLLVGDKKQGALIKGSYQSVNNSWRIDQAFAVRVNQTFMLFQGSRSSGHERKNMGIIESYGDKRTRANPAEFDQTNLLLKINQHINNNHKLGFTAERFGYNKDTHSLNASSGIYRPGSVHNEKDVHRERLSLFYNYNGDGSAILDAFHGQIYWQKQSNRQILNGYRVKAPQGDYLRDNFMRDIRYGLNISSLKKLNAETVDHMLKFSANVFASKFHQYASGKDNCHLPMNARGCAFLHTNRSDAPDTNSYGFGFSLEDEMRFSDNRFRVTPGIRYDWYQHTPQKTPAYEKVVGPQGSPPERKGSHFSPKLRAEWDANDQTTFYAQWAQAFRAPSVPELYLTYINPSFYYMKGNSNLKPETSNGYDIGIKYSKENFNGSIGAFINRYKNFIDITDEGPSREFLFARRSYINRANVRIFGVEAKAHWQLKDGFHSHLAFAYAQGKDIDTNEYLNSVPALKTVIGVGYKQENWGADIVLNLAAKRDNVEKKSDYEKIPGYSVVDISGWWKPFGEKGPIIRAGVYNFFNEKYWNASDLPAVSPKGDAPLPKDLFSQPGRNFKVSFVQKF
ncbi:TonB-dependent hemoglobin/transferrin/lactoferrin family receptor [Bartonella sp. F02]|uniref:TonB-dependent hemoglobin/transferrin/lactoferrin family receptor n=1 Tax=Bartonella sp. F02 TaxID=2967262 RepID=UPI0022A91DB8|nr:TonB-dependent hemoglobin/transferrin/lactoferrin family receptor [Bartonella sp. F02]MCZ2328521.1 TonB-dependent hemoglobin/transferrin/lactoferrin family receptor [Bartonella sp. F02]